MACNDILGNEVIKAQYLSINLPFKVANVNFLTSVCEDNDCKNIKIQLIDNHNQPITKYLNRHYFRNHSLFSLENTTGKVAFHQICVLNDQYREKGFAKSLHEQELNLYRTFAFKEIHLDAVSYGLVVWPKLFFDFVNSKSENNVIRKFQSYLTKVWNLDNEQIEKRVKSLNGKIKNIPLQYLKTNGSKISFGEWLSQGNNGNMSMCMMYKVVS